MPKLDTCKDGVLRFPATMPRSTIGGNDGAHGYSDAEKDRLEAEVRKKARDLTGSEPRKRRELLSRATHISRAPSRWNRGHHGG
jgi:hypothetical protein